MTTLSTVAERAVRARRNQARKTLSGALGQAMSEVGASQSGAARWMRVTSRTVRNWLSLASPMNVEAVLASPKLHEPFRRALCSAQHTHHSASYIAKPNSARRKSARKGAR